MTDTTITTAALDLASLWPLLILVGAAAIALGVIVWKRPEKVTRIRINLLWLTTLVAILTLVFGIQLIQLIMQPPEGKSTNTIEIVLSSLVGVGIGGLIAIAGQLVQDSGQDSGGNQPSDTDDAGKS